MSLIKNVVLKRIFLIPIFIIPFLIANPVSSAEPIEYQLAVVDAGGYVPENDISVARFRSLLDLLESKFVEDRGTIAGMTVKAQQLLKSKGVQEKMLNMMEGINKLFPRRFPNQKYYEYLAIYVTLRNQGQTHREALRGIEALLEAFGVR